MAEKNGIKELFERERLRFLLHYGCGAYTRARYYERLTKIWEHDLQGASYDNDQNGGKKAKFRLKIMRVYCPTKQQLLTELRQCAKTIWKQQRYLLSKTLVQRYMT